MLDIRDFFQATNPANTLFIEDPEADQKYYIDFSGVRGGHVIEELRDQITLWAPEQPTCQLLTGHIGCGKSTELLRLKTELEREHFHVVYFESSQDLEMGDVDIGEILLSITCRVTQSLSHWQPELPKRLPQLLRGMIKLLDSEITSPDLRQLSLDARNLAQLAAGIRQVTAKAKASPELRSKLRAYLGPRTSSILEMINQELLEPAITALKEEGKKGLVVIVDNLDKVHSSPKAWGRPQQEYLFIDRGEQLRSLNCHLVYTMPMALRFSNELDLLNQRFLSTPKVLPMVPVKLRDGRECVAGMDKLREMVLARAFPTLSVSQRWHQVSQVFDRPETLDRLCRVSGGHVRNLLRMLNESIVKQRGLPIDDQSVDEVIRAQRNERLLALTEFEWGLLRRVQAQKKVVGDDHYQLLIRSLFVYEYQDAKGSWFDINPILIEESKL